MQKLTTNQIRQRFLDFFAKKQHEVVPSSSLIPAQDPTLLFANAGMNQFKDLFLGLQSRSYKTATSSQKCVRAGGKHNDLDEVGFTDRHLTFFEMLGNFSFGDYFKKDAIKFAWEFLTQDLQLDPQRLSVTVHHTDDEAFAIWRDEIGVPENKITREGDAENFWQMGDTGPCGPCTEIFYDQGVEFENKLINGKPATRHVEVWNLVFMQFDQAEDGSRKPLKQTGVDTGMGLERLAMVLQGGQKIYDIDIFQNLFTALGKKVSKNYSECDDKTQAAFHVVADHLRSASLIIADGGKPSNDGRGYVLRKIIRRGLLFVKKLAPDLTIFVSLLENLVQEMGADLPELKNNQDMIRDVLAAEVQRFEQNLGRGQNIFAKYLQESAADKVVSGRQAFKLYDTYGFPVEVTKVLAEEEGFTVDFAGFDAEMAAQKARSGAKKGKGINFDLPEGLHTEFVGYEATTATSKISWTLEIDGQLWFSTEQSPFFAACGGQVSDSGKVVVEGQEFKVVEVKRLGTGAKTEAIILQVESVDGASVSALSQGVEIELVVEPVVRADTAKNHTGTHLLQAALRTVLGKHAEQSGSLVHPDYLRFSFTHDKAMSLEEVCEVERLINLWITQNHKTDVVYTSLEEANKLGAMALFGEKYNPEEVRVVTVGDFSAELCGGTHLKASGEIGAFKIVSEDALGVGIRVINAVTGPKAIQLFQQRFNLAKSLSEKFAAKPEQLLEKVIKQEADLKASQKELKVLRKEMLQLQLPAYEARGKQVGDTTFFFIELSGASGDGLRTIAQHLVKKDQASFVFLINKTADRYGVLAASGKKNQIDAGQLKAVITECGLRAGGKPEMLQGGGQLSCSLQELEQKLHNIL